MDIKNAYDLVVWKIIYKILLEFFKQKTGKRIKMRLNKTCSNIHSETHLSTAFFVQNSLKQGDVSSPMLLVFTTDTAVRRAHV
jgi:hypothetical protein